MSGSGPVWCVPLCAALGGGLVVACGMKGPPLPPIVVVPDRVSAVRAERHDDRIHLRFEVPPAGGDRARPSDLARIEIFALTTDPDLEPPTPAPVEDWIEAATLVAAYTVRDPAVPVDDDEAAGTATGGDVVAPGETVTLVERLAPAHFVPVVLAADDEDDQAPADLAAAARPVPRPAVAPPLPRPPRRTYLVRGVSGRGRDGPPSNRVSVSLAEASPPPGPPRVSHTESAVVVEWDEAVGARLPVQRPAADGVLPSVPVVAGAEPSTYLVYAVDVEREAAPAIPEPLNAPAAGRGRPPAGAAPVATAAPAGVETRYEQTPVAFDRASCFVVRTRTLVDGLPVIGPASPPTCLVPVDTFPPQPPTNLIAVAGDGAISLVWDPGPEPDLAGYRVLRRVAAGATLEPLTDGLVAGTSYRDTAVDAGERYAYALQAVDEAAPPNVSEPSAEVVEQAR